ncbi:MAG: hypothetical protein JWO03_3644 [Bacteroidetes bacterium]|nr:hypothetical protein [Bacteroidota bacterium]
MKHVYLSLLFTTLVLFSFGQTTFDSTDMPQIGWAHRMAIDDHPQNLNFGNSGPNQVYDFSNLNFHLTDTVRYDSLTAAQKLILPAATYYITSNYQDPAYTNIDSGVYQILATHTTLARLDTLFTYTPPVPLYRFPVLFGDSFFSSSTFYTTLPGAKFNPPYIYTNMRMRIRSGYTEFVDGWGKLILPGCVYDCLRMKRVIRDTIYTEQKYTVILYRPVDTLITERIEYYYITKEAKGTALIFDYDTSGSVKRVRWSLNPSPILPPYFLDTLISGGAISFTDTSNIDRFSQLEWNFGDSSAISSLANTRHVYSTNGNYLACLTLSECHTSTMICDSIVITQLVPGLNFAPIAADDTATVLAGHSITILPLTNDFDPNSDSLYRFCLEYTYNQHCHKQLQRDNIY